MYKYLANKRCLKKKDFSFNIAWSYCPTFFIYEEEKHFQTSQTLYFLDPHKLK